MIRSHSGKLRSMEPNRGNPPAGGDVHADDVQTTFRMAVGAVNAGDHQRARQLFAEVTARRPEIATAWLWRAHLEEEPREKIDFLRRAHHLDPDDTRTARTLHRTLLQTGIDLAKRGDHELARQLLREITDLQPENEIAWLWRVSVAATVEEKRRLIERVLEINPGNGQALAWREQLATTPATPSGAVQDETPCVLVIDDSITVRVLVRRTLEPLGYRVQMAASAREARERLAAEIPGLILLDVALPDTDGYALCKSIHADPETRAVPVIMLADRDGVGERFRRRFAGALGAVTKPFEAEDLVRAAERYLPFARG